MGTSDLIFKRANHPEEGGSTDSSRKVKNRCSGSKAGDTLSHYKDSAWRLKTRLN